MPKFSIRHTLLAMILFSMLALCLAGAARGNPVGYGLIAGTVLMVIPVLVMAAVYWCSLLLAMVLGRHRSPVSGEPQAGVADRLTEATTIASMAGNRDQEGS